MTATRETTDASTLFDAVHAWYYVPEWWSQPGSNRRPPACKAGALPAELWPLWSGHRRMVGLGRFELPASPLSGVRSDQLSYRPGFRDVSRQSPESRRSVQLHFNRIQVT